MRSLWPQLAAWLDAGEPFALATVTAVSGSAPRVPGSCMALMPDSARFIGSVSSGCLDVEVLEAARTALRTGATQWLRFGPDGNPPWTDGLTCGGWIAVRVEPWWAHHARAEVRALGPVVRGWLERDEAGIVISDDRHHLAIDARGTATGDVDAFSADEMAHARASLRAEFPPAEIVGSGRSIFVRTVRQRARLWMVGGGDVAVHLVALARESGFATTVIDPRAAFVAVERFPSAPDQLVRAWPQEKIARSALGPRDVALALTHDPKIDDVALLALLETRAGYIGALGSTRSHVARLDRLRIAGAADGMLARIRGPAGLHLGTPDAVGIALGIMAGVVQWQAEQERTRLVEALAAWSSRCERAGERSSATASAS